MPHVSSITRRGLLLQTVGLSSIPTFPVPGRNPNPRLFKAWNTFVVVCYENNRTLAALNPLLIEYVKAEGHLINLNLPKTVDKCISELQSMVQSLKAARSALL